MGQDLFCCSFIVVPLYSVVQLVSSKTGRALGKDFLDVSAQLCVLCVCVCVLFGMSFIPFAPFILWLSIFQRERERERELKNFRTQLALDPLGPNSK